MKRLYVPLALVSIFLWSLLAYLGASLKHLPPLFVTGMALTLSGLLSLSRIKHWELTPRILLVGVGGIFGYHFFYFSALHRAPVVEANLLNYLWPLFIVLFTPLFFREHSLHFHHIAGTLLGFTGAGLIISQGRFHFSPVFLAGYLFAVLAALTWAFYSLMTKRLPAFPSSSVGAFCLVSGILSLGILAIHGSPLTAIRQLQGPECLYLLLLGLGPLGLAFFTWDAALKRGDPRVIGALTYLTPLLSTLILVKLGGYPLTRMTGTGMMAIILGALIGSRDLFRISPST